MLKIGERVQLHPGLDDWMRGDRYGEVVKLGREQLFRPLNGGALYAARGVYVKLDKSGKVRTYHPERITAL